MSDCPDVLVLGGRFRAGCHLSSLLYLHCSPHLCVIPPPPPPHSDAKHRAESELGPLTRPRSNTLPKSFGSTLDQSAYDAAAEVKGQRPTKEDTLDLIQRRVKGKRQEDGWPDDIKVRPHHFTHTPSNSGESHYSV